MTANRQTDRQTNTQRDIVGGVVQSLDCTVYTQNVSTLRSSSDVCMVASIQAVYIHIGAGSGAVANTQGQWQQTVSEKQKNTVNIIYYYGGSVSVDSQTASNVGMQTVWLLQVSKFMPAGDRHPSLLIQWLSLLFLRFSF